MRCQFLPKYIPGERLHDGPPVFSTFSHFFLFRFLFKEKGIMSFSFKISNRQCIGERVNYMWVDNKPFPCIAIPDGMIGHSQHETELLKKLKLYLVHNQC